MNKYLFFIIIGIILFVLYNHIDSFNIGIVQYVLFKNIDNSYSIDEAGVAGDGTQTLLWTGDLEEIQFGGVNEFIQDYPGEDPRPLFDFLNEDEEAEAEAVPPCPAIPEGVANGLCQPEPDPESKCASRSRSSLDGPGISCGQPSVVTGSSGGGGGGSGSRRRTPCSRFLQTNAVRCFADNPDIMISLFKEYELLSALLNLPEEQVRGLEYLSPTMQRQMLKSRYGTQMILIFDFIRNNCQLFRFNDVLEILNGITLDNSHFRNEITDLNEMKRRSRIIIYILLLLIKCNLPNDFIKRILYYVISSFLISNGLIADVGKNTYNRRGILVYNILYSLFYAFIHMNMGGDLQIGDAINRWLSLQGDRFNQFIDASDPESIPSYKLWQISEILTYDDYISLFQYLSDNWPPSMMNGSERPDIISALMDPIFRNFFGLPDPDP